MTLITLVIEIGSTKWCPTSALSLNMIVVVQIMAQLLHVLFDSFIDQISVYFRNQSNQFCSCSSLDWSIPDQNPLADTIPLHPCFKWGIPYSYPITASSRCSKGGETPAQHFPFSPPLTPPQLVIYFNKNAFHFSELQYLSVLIHLSS